MEWAIDIQTKQHIHANSSNILPCSRLVCPNCNAPVKYRRGTKRIPHFAHLSGFANLDCDLYVPPTLLGNKRISHSISYKNRPFDIYIRLIDKKNPTNWHLELGLTEPNSMKGSIKVPFAWDGTRNISLSSIHQGGKRIRIIPQSEDYILHAVEVDENHWTNRIGTPINGLNNDKVNIFKYSPYGGRRLKEDSALFWGKTYVIISKKQYIKNIRPKLPFIIRKELSEIKEWTGFIISLPSEQVRYVESWIRSTCNRSVEHSPVELRLISPLPESCVEDGTLIIPSSTEVIIGLVGKDGSKKWKEISVAHSEEETFDKYVGNGNVPVFLSIGKPKPGIVNVWLDEQYDEGLTLICTDKTNIPQYNHGISFTFENRVDKELTYAYLHNKNTSYLLKNVRSKNQTIKEVSLPDKVILRMRWKKKGGVTWKSIQYGLDDNLENHIPLVDRLNALLTDNRIDLELEAGSFGKILVPSSIQESNSIISMSNEWRRRAEWLIRQNSIKGNNRIPNNYRAMVSQVVENINLFHVIDQNLIRKLINVYIEFSKDILPYLFALLQELRIRIHEQLKN